MKFGIYKALNCELTMTELEATAYAIDHFDCPTMYVGKNNEAARKEKKRSCRQKQIGPNERDQGLK